jgi:glycosyltransferase involved in cell wall biosynthesis
VETKGLIGFVPPRYGDDVVGGAEAVMRENAWGLAARGWDVEVLTTCARDHFTWANVYDAGVTATDGITLRRFLAVNDSPGRDRARVSAEVHAGRSVSLADQERWMNDSLRVPDLFHFLLDHSTRYRALVFGPSLFWPAFACGQLSPERTILMPCLHDEPEAKIELFQPLFRGARGIWFLSEPERDLALRLHPGITRTAVVGAGVDVPRAADPEGFRARHGVTGPFLLYAGRREGGKNWERLLDMFAGAVTRGALPLSLVTMGVGEVRPPRSIADRVIDLGFVSDQERNDAFAAASAYVQPSQNESFSRTVMEAWLAGTLVIANGASDVVAWHCDRSGAGLTYEDDFEFEQCLRFLVDAPDAARALAARGRAYVEEHYAPALVLDRLEETLAAWTSAPAEASA